MTYRPSPALSLAAVATAAAVLGLAWTESYSPAGSPVGWLMMVVLLAGHLPLLRGEAAKEPMPVQFPVPRPWIGWAMAALVLAGTATVVSHHVERIFTQPLLPRASVQLGIIQQAIARIATDQPLYAVAYQRQGYDELIGSPPGLVLAFAAARANGLDCRFTSLAAVALAGLLVALATLLLAASRWEPADELDGAVAVMAVAAAGILPLIQNRTLEFLQWGHTPPLWPLMVAFGICLGLGWNVLAGLAAGLLASMSVGWLPMLAPVAALLWRGPSRRTALAAMLLPPLAAYGAWRGEGEALGQALLGTTFAEGAAQASKLVAWREATLHGLTDFLALRPGVYLLGLVAVGAATCHAAGRHRTTHERINAVALAHLALIACGPVAHFFHWTAHALLLAGLIPAAALAAPRLEAAPVTVLRIGWRELLVALGGGGALAALAILPIRDQLFDTIDRQTNFRQGPQDQLFLGWNVDQGTYTWAKDTVATTGFWLDRPQAGLLELQLGSLSGDFTAWNPLRVRVNGAEKGVYFIAPGKEAYARVPLRASDLNIGFNAIEIEAKWARTPRSLNIYPDDRMVSFRYRGLRFVPETALSPADRLTFNPPRRIPL